VRVRRQLGRQRRPRQRGQVGRFEHQRAEGGGVADVIPWRALLDARLEAVELRHPGRHQRIHAGIADAADGAGDRVFGAVGGQGGIDGGSGRIGRQQRRREACGQGAHAQRQAQGRETQGHEVLGVARESASGHREGYTTNLNLN
jgi:hypothetical protein